MRFGYAHVANNWYNKWEMYAMGGSADPTIFSQGNYFMAPDDPFSKQVILIYCKLQKSYHSGNYISKFSIITIEFLNFQSVKRFKYQAYNNFQTYTINTIYTNICKFKVQF